MPSLERIFPAISGALNGAGCVGASSYQLSSAISNGLFGFLNTSVTVFTIDSGTAGVGKGTLGVVIYLPALLTPTLLSNAKGALINGSISESMLVGLSLSICGVVSSAIPMTVHPIVGVGTGVGRLLIKEPGTGIGIFLQSFAAAGLISPMAISLSNVISNSLNATISTASVLVQIAGPPSPVPASGVGTGVLI